MSASTIVVRPAHEIKGGDRILLEVATGKIGTGAAHPEIAREVFDAEPCGWGRYQIRYYDNLGQVDFVVVDETAPIRTVVR